MPKFEPTKRNLWETMLFCFHLKKSAAGCHRLLVEAYVNHTSTVQTVENWFRRFKSGDFDLEDEERPGQPKKCDQDQDPCVTLEITADELNVDVSTVSKRLKAIGVIQRQGNWLSYQLKPKDIGKAPCDVLKTYLERLDWEMLLHSPYSPDIAPSDYYLFWLMSHAPAEKRFQSFKNIKKWVDS